MKVRLLDTNVLISLLDSAHVHHGAVRAWFRSVAVTEGWATNPITENGFIRVVSHVSYPNLRFSALMAAEALNQLKNGFQGIHQFWGDALSLADVKTFDLGQVAGPKQLTDVYLAGLALANGGRLATLDRGLCWRAVRGADAGLIDNIVG